MAKLRVLTVLPGITPDAGAEQSMAALLPRVVDAGVNVHLALFTERQALVPMLERAGVVVHDLSSSRSTWARVRALRDTIAAIEPDVVHATLFEAAVPAQLAVLRTGVPVLVTWASTSYDPGSLAEMGRSAWKLRVVQLVEIVLARVSRARFHAVTAGVARVNSANLRVPADRVLVGERGRDPERLVVDDAAVDAVRAELGVDHGGQLVLAVGRQEPQKGYSSLLTAFDEVAATHPGATLAIAGRSGRDTPALERQLTGLAHRSAIRFLGQRDDVATLLTAADLVVCASWREGAAGALIEAMACGAPILTVPLEGTEDVVVDGLNGRVVPRESLASGIAGMLDDRATADRFAAEGRRTFAERFTLERSTEQMIEIYRTVGG
ncbi:MAG: glycosyltransferase family 4 protein [Acidimicrobiales bacterium]